MAALGCPDPEKEQLAAQLQHAAGELSRLRDESTREKIARKGVEEAATAAKQKADQLAAELQKVTADRDVAFGMAEKAEADAKVALDKARNEAVAGAASAGKEGATKLAAVEAEKTKLAAELAKLKADGEKAEKDRAAKSSAADGEKAKLVAELEKLKGDAGAAGEAIARRSLRRPRAKRRSWRPSWRS